MTRVTSEVAQACALVANAAQALHMPPEMLDNPFLVRSQIASAQYILQRALDILHPRSSAALKRWSDFGIQAGDVVRVEVTPTSFFEFTCKDPEAPAMGMAISVNGKDVAIAEPKVVTFRKFELEELLKLNVGEAEGRSLMHEGIPYHVSVFRNSEGFAVSAWQSSAAPAYPEFAQRDTAKAAEMLANTLLMSLAQVGSGSALYQRIKYAPGSV